MFSVCVTDQGEITDQMSLRVCHSEKTVFATDSLVPLDLDITVLSPNHILLPHQQHMLPVCKTNKPWLVEKKLLYRIHVLLFIDVQGF